MQIASKKIMNTNFVTTTFSGGMAFDANINHHHIIMDTGSDDGGIDSGPGPKRLMLASLAACTGMDIVSILNKMKVNYSDLIIDTEATLTEEHPKIYNYVKVTYKIKMVKGDQAKMEKATKLSEDKYCGVMAMFKAFARVETEIIFL